MRTLSFICALLALTACQDPFGSDRHDLLGDRIVAVTLSPSGGRVGVEVQASVALSVDGVLWADEPTALAWIWVDTVADAATVTPDDAVNTDVIATLTRPEGAGALAVVATFASGHIERAALSLTDTARTADPVSSLGLDTRTAVADDVVPLSVAAPQRTRFMTVGGRGTVVETSRTQANLLIAQVTFDDGEEEVRTPTPEGPLTVFGLALGDGNAWRAEDIWVGEPPSGLWTSQGRFLPSDVDVDLADDVRLAADDDAPWGLRITDTRPADDAPLLDLDALIRGEQLRGELAETWVRLP